MTRFGIAFLVIVGSVAAKDHQTQAHAQKPSCGATTTPRPRPPCGFSLATPVEMETAMIASPEMLTSAGLPASQVASPRPP